MPPKVIKLGKKDDLGSVIKQIKNLRDREVWFVLENGSPLLKQPQSLRIIKKAGEVLGKTIHIEGMEGLDVVEKTTQVPIKSRNPNSRFSDIKVSARKPVLPAAIPVSKPVHHARLAEPIRENYREDGSRYEVEFEKSSSKFSKFFILFLVVLVIAVFGLAVLLPRADITVQARSEPVARDIELTVDKSAGAPSADTLIIPAVTVNKEVSQTKTFQTSGQKVSGTKATGNVTIFNNTANIFKFSAKTTTLVAGGKKYLLTKDIAGIKPGAAGNPNISIEAETGGVDYNLPAQTKFTIVNAALGNQNVTASNPQALSGGTTGQATKILSQTDLDNAVVALTADIIAQTESDLSSETGSKMRVLDSAVKKDILAKTANKEVGAEVDTFDMTLIARVTGLAFREDDVISVIVSKINEVLSSDKYLLENAQRTYNPVFKSIDLTKGTGVLDVHFETEAAYKVDTTTLPKLLAGKNESEIKEILLSKPEVDNVEVKFWPAWFVHKAPRFNGKIYINTILSK